MLPYGAKEAFFLPEIVELPRHGHSVTVVPMHPRASRVHGKDLVLDVMRQPLVSLEVVLYALASALTAPVRTLKALALIFRSRNAAIFSKNLVALPKALWLARKAKQSGADHIHAQWA